MLAQGADAGVGPGMHEACAPENRTRRSAGSECSVPLITNSRGRD
jgi:hypothetical protein